MNKHRKTATVLIFLDAVMLLVVFNIVALSWLREVIAPGFWITDALSVPLVLVMIGFYLIDGYKARTDMMSLDYTSEHLIALFACMVTTLLITFVLLPAGYPLQQSRAVITLSFLAYMPISLGYRRIIYATRQKLRNNRTLIFVGNASSCEIFAAECARMEFIQPVVYTVLTPESETDDQQESIKTTLSQLENGELEVEAIVLRESGIELSPAVSQRLVQLYFRGVPTYTLELFHQIYWRKIPLYRLNQTWLFQEGFHIAREPIFERLKRLSDIVLSLIGIVVGAPIFFFAAIAIWLDDRGTVFFAQTRIGRNRVPFQLLKFRTMRPNDGSEAYTRAGDARITRVGRILRASRLDEWPQMINVLRGDMSLIGPRAEWDKLVVPYEAQIPCYHFRHLVKPGITGWAQVNYPYGANLDDTVRKLEYDLYYIRHFSFLLDAAIVLKTIHIMLFGKGR